MDNREINSLVAEKVMGFIVEKGSMHYDGSDIHYEIWIDSEGNKHNPKNYSTTIQDAWLVAEKLKELGEFNIGNESTERRWISEMYTFKENGDLDKYLDVEHLSAPMSICLVALKLVGIEQY